MDDYKITEIKLRLEHMNVADKIDLHKKTWEVIFTKLLQSTIGMEKLLGNFKKLEKQLNEEKGLANEN